MVYRRAFRGADDEGKLYAGDVAKPGDAAKVKVLTEDIRNFEQKLVEQTSGNLKNRRKGSELLKQERFPDPFWLVGTGEPQHGPTG